MDTQNEDKRELSEESDSSTSAVGTCKESQDRDPRQKVDRILAACEEPRDLDLLIRLATSTGGLINDGVRKIACRSLAEWEIPSFLRLTAVEGPFCLATQVETQSTPALLSPGRIFQAIKTKIKSSLT